MITAFIVIGALTAYILAGFGYARSQIHRCVRRAEQWLSPDSRRDSVNAQLAWRVCLWPVALVIDTVTTPIRTWVWRPETERVERLARLREDREAWAGRLREGSTDDQRMATDIVATLDDVLAREERPYQKPVE